MKNYKKIFDEVKKPTGKKPTVDKIQQALNFIASSKTIIKTLNDIEIFEYGKNKTITIPKIGRVNKKELQDVISSEKTKESKKIVGTIIDFYIAQYNSGDSNVKENILTLLSYRAEKSKMYKDALDKLMKSKNDDILKKLKSNKDFMYLCRYTRLSNAFEVLKDKVYPMVDTLYSIFDTEGGWFSALHEFIEYCKENNIPGVKYLNNSSYKKELSSIYQSNKKEFEELYDRYLISNDKSILDEIENMINILNIEKEFINNEFSKYKKSNS